MALPIKAKMRFGIEIDTTITCTKSLELQVTKPLLTYNVTLICFIYFDDNNKKKMD